ncbi:MAG TPA: hypothetical protein VJB97_02475 [Candidatus Paceibacterota bacterium]
MTSLTAAFTGFFILSNFTSAGLAMQAVQAAPAPEPQYVTHTVAMTAYNAVPEQTDNDPFTTASGAYSDTDIVAARSVDLASTLPFGTVIELTTSNQGSTHGCGLSLVEKQIGLRVIADSMHPRKVNQIDILLDQHKTVQLGVRTLNPAVALGYCRDIEIRVIGRIDIKSMPKDQQELRLAVGRMEQASEQFLAIKK